MKPERLSEKGWNIKNENKMSLNKIVQFHIQR